MEGGNSSYPDLICSYLEPNTKCTLPSESGMRQIERICSAAAIQNRVLFTIALVLGLPGSILAFIIVSRLPLKPSTLYMRLLAATDFLSLVLVSMTFYKILDLQRTTEWEEISKWLGRLFQAFSHWLLVLICVERYVTVRFPLHKTTVYTMPRTWLTCLVAFLISSIPLVLFSLHFSKTVQDRIFRFWYIVIYLSIYTTFPMIAIVTFTSLTAAELRKSQRRRRTLMASAGTSKASKLEADLTRMMLLSAICFVILLFPFFIFHLFDRIDDYWLHLDICPVGAAVEYYVLFTVAAISFLNHAINFYLYVFVAGGFRKELFNFFRGKTMTGGKSTNVSSIS